MLYVLSPQQKDKNVSSRRAKIRVRFTVYRNHRLLEQCIMIYIIDITKKKLFLSSQSSKEESNKSAKHVIIHLRREYGLIFTGKEGE